MPDNLGVFLTPYLPCPNNFYFLMLGGGGTFRSLIYRTSFPSNNFCQNTFQPKPKKKYLFLFSRISELVVVNIMPWISQWETVLMMNATKTPLYPSYPRLWSVTNPQPSFYNVALILYLGIGWVALMSLLKVSLNHFSKNHVKLLQFSSSLCKPEFLTISQYL